MQSMNDLEQMKASLGKHMPSDGREVNANHRWSSSKRRRYEDETSLRRSHHLGCRMSGGVAHVHALTSWSRLLRVSLMPCSICLLLCNDLSGVELD